MTLPYRKTSVSLIRLVFNVIRTITGIVEYVVLSIARVTRWLWDRLHIWGCC